jgi:hydrogenase maturation protein HypF
MGIKENKNDEIYLHSILIIINGLVQGVGFRPFIYKLAHSYGLKGWVKNTTGNVLIRLEGNKNNIDKFIVSLKLNSPKASIINEIKIENKIIEHFTDFSIIKSDYTNENITQVCPDIAVCDECLEDMESQLHRHEYLFINCTNCGPRFTIIENLPYDREQTTMKKFKMCDICKSEYENPFDRRFHAQPVACINCGPSYTLYTNNKEINESKLIIKKCCELLENGYIIAIKGLGGFHLACNAFDEEAVKRLRNSKMRDGKPFAAMFSSVEILNEYAYLSTHEIELLTSWRRPILILQAKKALADSVSNGFSTIGAMLPYLPFHYALFKKLKLPAIVLTSGNISDEPIIIENEKAIVTFNNIADAILINNRDIINRTDDSVCFVVNKKQRIIRRSRGFVPEPIYLKYNTEGIFAAGAELINTFAIGKQNQAIISQHIGDLKNYETYKFYEESFMRFKKLFRFEPNIAACDMHPDYLSTKFVHELKIPIIQIQHHHAHVAAVMAEYNLDEKVIGIALDGTGYGDDGNIWGGEFFICDLENYKRITHFDYVPMPGGDAVINEPWRMAVSYLYKIFGENTYDITRQIFKKIENKKIEIIINAIKKKINCPFTSSLGRLFDTVAAITGICTVSSFHAEAPMRLENCINKNINDQYPFEINDTININTMINSIIKDIKNNIHPSIISARFHNTIISVIFAVVNQIRFETGIHKIILSGGSFQNRYLLEKTEKKLLDEGFKVYIPEKIPVNDGGISLGQLIITAKRRNKICV